MMKLIKWRRVSRERERERKFGRKGEAKVQVESAWWMFCQQEKRDWERKGGEMRLERQDKEKACVSAAVSVIVWHRSSRIFVHVHSSAVSKHQFSRRPEVEAFFWMLRWQTFCLKDKTMQSEGWQMIQWMEKNGFLEEAFARPPYCDVRELHKLVSARVLRPYNIKTLP